MKPDRLISLVCIVALAFFILLCSCASLTGGDGTETGNARVVGKVVDSLGKPVSQARVILLPALYNPVTDPAVADSMCSSTDEHGHYRLKTPGPGAYSVEITYGDASYKALITDIIIDNKDSITVSESVLRKPGALRVVLPDTAHEANGYVYLPGTTCYGSVQGGIATLRAVPAGLIPTIYYANKVTQEGNHLIRANVTVQSNDTQFIVDTTGWKYSKKLYLNTTAGGADIGRDVYSFPVLVRLTSTNFDFSRARSDGADIRFAKSSGVPLNYEIDRWDAGSQRAEIWVKVDTVYGNDSTQSLTMYWGNANAASQSNGASVFDTANGFAGVWHLSETGNAISKDATGNHYDGMPSDTAPAEAEGAIGPCRSFNGSSNFIRMNGTANSKLNFPENGTYTISAWVYIDSLDNGYHVIAGKSNEQFYLKFKLSNQNIKNSPMVWEFVDYFDKTGYNITNSLPSVPQTKVWNYIIGIRKGTQQFLYVNGELADSTSSLNSWVAPRNTGDDVTIGKFISAPADTTGGRCPFLGKIDEVRISNSAYNADWIKLSYMNQKQPDGLIKW